MALGERLRRLDERAGIDRFKYKTPRSRIRLALALQFPALLVMLIAEGVPGVAWFALPFSGAAAGLLIGYLRETRE